MLVLDLILGLWLWLSGLLKRLPGGYVSGTVVRDDSSGHVGTLRLILIARPTGVKSGDSNTCLGLPIVGAAFTQDHAVLFQAL